MLIHMVHVTHVMMLMLNGKSQIGFCWIFSSERLFHTPIGGGHNDGYEHFVPKLKNKFTNMNGGKTRGCCSLIDIIVHGKANEVRHIRVRPVLKGNPRFLAKGYVNCLETQFSYRGTLAHSIMYKNYSRCLARL